MLPKVSPVNISSAVYMPSRASNLIASGQGQDAQEFRDHFQCEERCDKSGRADDRASTSDPAFKK